MEEEVNIVQAFNRYKSDTGEPENITKKITAIVKVEGNPTIKAALMEEVKKYGK